MNKAIFLDRDGTINVDFGYVYKTQELELLPGVAEALRIFQELGYLLIVITNQSGIGRGYFTLEDAEDMVEDQIRMDKEAGREPLAYDPQFFYDTIVELMEQDAE